MPHLSSTVRYAVVVSPSIGCLVSLVLICLLHCTLRLTVGLSQSHLPAILPKEVEGCHADSLCIHLRLHCIARETTVKQPAITSGQVHVHPSIIYTSTPKLACKGARAYVCSSTSLFSLRRCLLSIFTLMPSSSRVTTVLCRCPCV
jgi:hypothetical protein